MHSNLLPTVVVLPPLNFPWANEAKTLGLFRFNTNGACPQLPAKAGSSGDCMSMEGQDLSLPQGTGVMVIRSMQHGHAFPTASPGLQQNFEVRGHCTASTLVVLTARAGPCHAVCTARKRLVTCYKMQAWLHDTEQ